MTCDACREFIHEDGQIKMTQSQTPVKLRRPAGTLPPCHRCPKVPKAVQKDSTPRKWEYAADVAGDVKTVYDHYRKCVTLGRKFPDDEIVEENAFLVAEAERLAAERLRDQSENRLDFVLQRLLVVKGK